MRMPFGKHRGEELHDVPDDYLVWVLDNIEDLRPTLRRAIEEQLGIGRRPPPPPPPPPPPSGGIATGAGVTMEKVIRAMTLKYHPDRGGSHEVMVAINEGAELLRQLAGIK